MESEQIAELESAVINSIESWKEELGEEVPTSIIVGVLNVVSHIYIAKVISGKVEVGHSPQSQWHTVNEKASERP